MEAQVPDGRTEPFDIFFEEPDRRVARVAQQAADEVARVIVIDVEMVKEDILVTRALCRLTRRPVLPANSAATILVLQHELERFKGHAIFSQEVTAPRLFAAHRIATIVFAIIPLATWTAP
jgi:hypothetical protein